MVRSNLQHTIELYMKSSDSFLTFSLLFQILKVMVCGMVLTSSETSCNVGILYWVIGSMIFDSIYAMHLGVRIPYVKAVAREERDAEPCLLLSLERFFNLLYVGWQIAGNIWYWTGHCDKNSTLLMSGSLFLLVCGYLFMLLPALSLATLCLCLPVAIVIIVFFLRNTNQNPATNKKLASLEAKPYNPDKHIGEPNCPICAEDFIENQPVVTLKCDERHFFHEDCIKKWLKINATCAICRAAI